MTLCLAIATQCLAAQPSRAQSYEAGYKVFEAGDHKRSIEIWLPLANAGDREAQFAIGNAYSNGHGVPKNAHQAVSWYWRSNGTQACPPRISGGGVKL